jgi:hypothetical protein
METTKLKPKSEYIIDNSDSDDYEDPEDRQYYNIGNSDSDSDNDEIIIVKHINKIKRIVYEETDSDDD